MLKKFRRKENKLEEDLSKYDAADDRSWQFEGQTWVKDSYRKPSKGDIFLIGDTLIRWPDEKPGDQSQVVLRQIDAIPNNWNIDGRCYTLMNSRSKAYQGSLILDEENKIVIADQILENQKVLFEAKVVDEVLGDGSEPVGVVYIQNGAKDPDSGLPILQALHETDFVSTKKTVIIEKLIKLDCNDNLISAVRDARTQRDLENFMHLFEPVAESHKEDYAAIAISKLCGGQSNG